MSVNVGRVGVWLRGYERSDAELVESARDLDRLGFGALWLGGAPADLHTVEAMLAATQRIVVATGIVSIWDLPAAELAANYRRVHDKYGDRFLLGLGVSHGVSVGERYRKPYSAMVSYLDELDGQGVPESDRVLAALGPKVLTLAAQRSAGAHPYLVTPEYIASARATLGAGPLLATEQHVVLDADLARAREIGRAAVAHPYLRLPNYLNNLRREGFTDVDFADNGSDRLIEALVATGDLAAVGTRVQALLDAGADHVCLQVITGDRALPKEQWATLAELAD